VGGFTAQSRSDQGSVSDRAPERASRFFRVREKKPQFLPCGLDDRQQPVAKSEFVKRYGKMIRPALFRQQLT
jgi:hypothetical protein